MPQRPALASQLARTSKPFVLGFAWRGRGSLLLSGGGCLPANRGSNRSYGTACCCSAPAVPPPVRQAYRGRSGSSRWGLVSFVLARYCLISRAACGVG
eukprot:9249561-Alexandrium_andersonii.AAC.1